jgi:hypothetical protein
MRPSLNQKGGEVVERCQTVLGRYVFYSIICALAALAVALVSSILVVYYTNLEASRDEDRPPEPRIVFSVEVMATDEDRPVVSVVSVVPTDNIEPPAPAPMPQGGPEVSEEGTDGTDPQIEDRLSSDDDTPRSNNEPAPSEVARIEDVMVTTDPSSRASALSSPETASETLLTRDAMSVAGLAAGGAGSAGQTPPAQPDVLPQVTRTVEPAATPVPATPAPLGVTIQNVNLTFYDCAGQGFCGKMYNGEKVYEGAAACSWNLPIGTRFMIVGDPTGRVYVCKDRGLLSDTWIDVFWHDPADGYAWQSIVGRRGAIVIVSLP